LRGGLVVSVMAVPPAKLRGHDSGISDSKGTHTDLASFPDSAC